MKKNNIFLILLMMLVTASCQTLKNAVSGVKQENSDEFFSSKKKSPRNASRFYRFTRTF